MGEMQPLRQPYLGEEVEKILLGAVCFASLGKELSVGSELSVTTLCPPIPVLTPPSSGLAWNHEGSTVWLPFLTGSHSYFANS